MLSHADVVKKSYLKYKATKIKGRNATSTQGPKTSYKEMFVVFRAPNGAEKCLDFYQNERKYSEIGPPRWSVDLASAISVNILHDNRLCFCLELGEGGACLFEAKTTESADEWVSCFNAVLFTKGARGESTLFYEVDLYQSERLSYHGPAYLELAEGFLIVWTMNTQERVVEWKLSHIRSFKAKKSVLTIYTGSRSSTGVGEFYFNSPLSVQITHAIETLVARLKSQKTASKASVASNGLSSSKLPGASRPLPPAPREHTSNGMPGVIENQSGSRLMRSSISACIPGHAPPDLYDDIGDPSLGHAHPRQLDLNGRVPRLSPPSGPPANHHRRGGYEEVPDGPFDSPEVPISKKRPSPPPAYRQMDQQPVEALYAQVDKEAKRKSRASTPDNLDVDDQPLAPPLPLADQAYGQLHHFDASPPQPPSKQEEYGKLVRPNRQVSRASPQPDEYGKLEHSSITSAGAVGYLPEEYGKLVRPNDSTPPSSYPEYGKLELGSSPPTVEAYGRLGNTFDPYGTFAGEDLEKRVKNGVGKPRPSAYETMDDPEEPSSSPPDVAIYSEVDGEPRGARKEFAAPPPGYENTVLKVTPAEKASCNRLSTPDLDRSPTSSPLPPRRKEKHSYVNVNEDGTVKVPTAAPRKAKVNGASSPPELKGRALTKTQSLEEASEPSLQPPVPPQRGITVHGRQLPNKRPPTAPKPKPLAKPRQ